jgi:hypothetical protein
MNNDKENAIAFMMEQLTDKISDPILRKSLANLSVSIAKKAINTPNEIEPEPKQENKKTPEKISELPLFHREAPPAPNAALRSALFSAIHSKDRQFINNELIASIDGVEVKLKGEQFNQDDLEVLLIVENEAKLHPDTLTCQISERGLLKLLERTRGNNAIKALSDSLVRLQQPVIVKMGRFSYSGGFIHHVYKDEETKRYVIQLNPQLGALLRSGWTALDIATRRQLAGKPLALWLQAFYASHGKPFAYKVETLRELSGSKTAELKHFRANLRYALDDWKATRDIQGWTIDENDLVQIVKNKVIEHQKTSR